MLALLALLDILLVHIVGDVRPICGSIFNKGYSVWEMVHLGQEEI